MTFLHFEQSYAKQWIGDDKSHGKIKKAIVFLPSQAGGKKTDEQFRIHCLFLSLYYEINKIGDSQALEPICG